MAFEEKNYNVAVKWLYENREDWDSVTDSRNYSLEIWSNQNGLRHRDDGPAVMVRSLITGKIVGECWYRFGEKHRDGDDPAWILREAFNTQAHWYRDGLLHRENGPAVLHQREIRSRPVLLREEWYRGGALHRSEGPALLVQSSYTGIRTQEEWHRDGRLDREYGPAMIVKDDKTGIAIEERWFKRGKLFHLGGPAIIQRDRVTGELTHQEFHGQIANSSGSQP